MKEKTRQSEMNKQDGSAQIAWTPEGAGEGDVIRGGGFAESLQKPSLLLHSCCGPCSTAVIERLADEFEITVFFYNPCITEEDEYILRRENQKKFLKAFNESRPGKDRIRFLEGPYHPGAFLKIVSGLEDEPEGGRRCEKCFAQRLEKTAETAQMTGNDYFGTTLTVSPHKNYRIISEIGRNVALRYGLTFLDRDFKKKDGFKRSIEMSRQYGLYRQDYCGCRFSRR